MVATNRELFLLNIGFVIHETVGYSRDFPIEADATHLPPDLDIFDLAGLVRVTRTAQGLLLQAVFRASTPAACSRCLADFMQSVQANFTELYAFSPNSMTESGFLVPESGKIDLAPIVRDEVLVAMPIKPLCSPACKGLCPVCGGNLNETVCRHDQDDLDPRLAILKDLIEKDQAPPPSPE